MIPNECSSTNRCLHTPDTLELLFVTPDARDAISLQRILSHSKWELRLCSGISDAVRELETHPVGVVICKKIVADGDWTKLAERIRVQANSPKLLIASSENGPSVWGDALGAGADYVLHMPFEERDVFRSVSDAWQRWWYARVDERRFDRSAPAPDAVKKPNEREEAAMPLVMSALG